MLVQVGIEGQTYTWNDQGKYVFTPDFLEKTENLDWNKAAAYGVGYYAQLVNNTPMLVEYRDIPSALQRADNMMNWQRSIEWWNLFDPDMKPTKEYYFVPGPVEIEKFPAVRDAELEFWAKVLTAQSEAEVEVVVNEWGATARALGVDAIVAERQAYIDNFAVPQ
jgi:hypothetical protein